MLCKVDLTPLLHLPFRSLKDEDGLTPLIQLIATNHPDLLVNVSMALVRRGLGWSQIALVVVVVVVRPLGLDSRQRAILLDREGVCASM